MASSICNFAVSVAARTNCLIRSAHGNRLVGFVVKVSVSRAADLAFGSRFVRGDFSGSGHTSDFNIDIQVGYPARYLALSWLAGVSIL